MGEEIITTGVDELIAYLRGKDRVPMQDAAMVLKIPFETLQAWVDFLVEEKILGIEYKFTKPYIYLNKADIPPAQNAIVEDRALTFTELRDAFMSRARDKRIPEAKLLALWRAHVSDALDLKKAYFLEQAIRRNAPNPESQWLEYRRDALERCVRG
jgi:hypothetical protein